MSIPRDFAFAAILLFLLCLSSLLPAAEAEAEARRGAGRRRTERKGGEEEQGKLRAENVTRAESPSKRQRRVFNLFNVVTFRNEPCSSTTAVAGVVRNGTCFTAQECMDRVGQSAGNCASGFGVCCIFVISTGMTTISQNCTYIQNENFPQALPNTNAVQFTVQKCADDVCLLRLDFETFNTLGAGGTAVDNEGDCMDTFVVTTPTSEVIPTICGLNTGQHIYVDIGENSGDTATLAFAFNGANAGFQRMFDIKVTQVECTNANAPRNPSCLQFLTGLTGRIESFNYDAPADNHLNNQQYSVCIRQEEDFCCIEYMVCADAMANLNAGAGAAEGFSFDTITANVAKSKVDDECVSAASSIDYISIPQAMAQCDFESSATQSKFCGGRLNFVPNLGVNAPVCDCTPPFLVQVFFNNFDDKVAARDDAIPNTKTSKGLCLEYRQIPCN